jgi:V8-like Glu-specific endopeptidase
MVLKFQKQYLITALLATSLLSACGAQHSQPVVESISAEETASVFFGQPSKIIGQNTMVPIKADGSNIDQNLRPYLNAIGLVVLAGGGVCSGTHIGNGMVLTAGHCFFDEGHIGARVLENKSCTGTEVRFGYRGSPATGNPKPLVSKIGKCLRIVHAEHSRDRDFAIIKLDQAPTAYIPLVASGRKPNVGLKLTILGYPRGRPLEWSQYCSLRITSAIGMESGSTDPSMFVYDCDTEPGNSGSAVLAISSQGKPYVVGIHNGSAPLGHDFNFATFLNDVRATVKLKGFDLDRATMVGGM